MGTEREPWGSRYRLARAWAVILPVLFVVLLVAAIREFQGQGPAPVRSAQRGGSPSQGLAVDRPASPFELSLLGQPGSVALEDFAGRVVFLNFWASWCPSCRKDAPLMQGLWEEYGPRGVQFLGVNVNDTREDAVAFEREFGITFPSVFDPVGELAGEYGVVGIPTMFVIGPDGRIDYRFQGRVDPGRFRSVIDEILVREGP
ncbi:MAG: TlpA family protein disulfide reductase [Actinomycetota bacterium]